MKCYMNSRIQERLFSINAKIHVPNGTIIEYNKNEMIFRIPNIRISEFLDHENNKFYEPIQIEK